MPALQTLVVNSSYSGLKAPAGWVEALCALLSVVPGLTHLDVGSNNLKEEGAALRAPVLQGRTCLQHVNLSDVSSRGMATLAPALAALPNLHTLNLRSSGLEDGFMYLLQPLLSKTGTSSPT